MRILVVDDEPAVRNMLKETLKSEGYAIDVAEDGDNGSYLGRCNDYDLIILDNRLPKKSGLEVCREIRDTGKATPILVLSALSDTREKTDLLNAGADDYVTKPYSFQELLARIHALLRRPAAIQEDILSFDDLVLDAKRHLVKRGKTAISLTRKEFGLLEYMLRHVGVTLTRGMLMEHVWDMDIDPFSNTIESHIASLRRKLETNGRTKIIRTVPGYGYKIDAF